MIQHAVDFVIIRPDFFYKLIYKPSYCNFAESREKIKFIFQIFFLFYLPTLNIICFVKKNNIFLGSVCVFFSFESDTVKSDCPVQIFRKI